MMAARIKQFPAFNSVHLMLVMPQFFLSGAGIAERAARPAGRVMPPRLFIGVAAIMDLG